jgi:ribosomal protein S18 acetylase RimI-like enzyme
MGDIAVRELQATDAAYQRAALVRHTAGPLIASRGRLYDGMAFGGHLAVLDGEPVGVAVVRPDDDGSAEVLFIATDRPGAGVGAALLTACADGARAAGAERVWLVTTNDNTPAIRFFQRQGWDLVALHHGAVSASRARKPTIPRWGHAGSEIRHELVFELRLRPGPAEERWGSAGAAVPGGPADGRRR